MIQLIVIPPRIEYMSNQKKYKYDKCEMIYIW